MNQTQIEWTDLTWNPVSGCVAHGPGCRFCYAKDIAERFPAFPNGFGLTVRTHKFKDPLRRRQASLIFVNSMSDLFWDEIPDDIVLELVEVMRQADRHIFQVLTKRPERAIEFSKRVSFPDNMWLGVSVENQKYVRRMEVIRDLDLPVKFISFEPLLGRIQANLDGFSWIITGGESGGALVSNPLQARRALVHRGESGYWEPKPEAIQWIKEIRNQCIEREIPFFHKQWGGCTPKACGNELDGEIWQQFPEVVYERGFRSR